VPLNSWHVFVGAVLECRAGVHSCRHVVLCVGFLLGLVVCVAASLLFGFLLGLVVSVGASLLFGFLLGLAVSVDVVYVGLVILLWFSPVFS
jgi:hypothetical protein